MWSGMPSLGCPKLPRLVNAAFGRSESDYRSLGCPKLSRFVNAAFGRSESDCPTENSSECKMNKLRERKYFRCNLMHKIPN